MLTIRILILVWCAVLSIGCTKDNREKDNLPIKVDFSQANGNHKEEISNDSIAPLHIAVSAMISPKETFAYYEELIKYISRKIGRKIEFKQRKTYKEVNTLLETRELDFAFICSGAYVEATKKFPLEILAVPVVHGEPLYRAYVITHKSYSINKFTDLMGKSFAFTDPLSNTGRLYAVKRVNEHGSTVDEFFKKTIYTYAHDHSIQVVARKIVDGATIDGLVYDYLKEKYPERVKDVRIIEISEGYGIPPVVIHKKINQKLKNELKAIFLGIDKGAEGKKILQKLMIDKFIVGNDTSYNSIRRNLRYLNND